MSAKGMLVGLNTSQSEREYTVLGVDMGVRPDGRGWLDYRSISVQGEVLPQANGSARITIAHGGTEVLAAVKIETGVPSADAPCEGRVEVCVECSNSLFPTFDDRSGGDVNAALSLMLARTVVESGALDLKSLCIIPGRFCWIVYLDVLVLQADGNLLDAASFAAYVAFNTALVPRTTVISGEGAGVEDDFEIDGDLNTATRLPGADKLPICISLSKIGGHFIVDTSIEEESCVDARVVVAVAASGAVCGVHKQGTGAVPAHSLAGMAQCAAGLAASITKVLDECVVEVNGTKESGGRLEAYSAFME